jgi:8-oxo-dGTP diphosphatase
MTDRQLDSGDQVYLETYDLEACPRPSVAVDVVILAAGPGVGTLRVMLTRRTEPPAQGKFALPGGFVGLNEPLEAAVERVLATKVGLTDIFTEQLATFGSPARDPRGRVISVAYYALVPGGALAVAGRPPMPALAAKVTVPWSGELDETVRVVDEDGCELELAFDHAEIIMAAITRLRGKIWYAPVAFELMPPEFTLAELRAVYEMVLGRRLNKDGFRKRILSARLVTPVGRNEALVSHRPAQLYRFGYGGLR